MSDINLEEIQIFAQGLALEAGKRIKAASDNRASAAQTADNTKKNSVDLVTATDQAVEKFVKETLSAKYPTHKFIGEESYAGGEKAELTDDPTWIIDPIDGTTNFVHGFTHTCISIGFTLNKIPTVGVVYSPFLEKLYSARKGAGAYVNRTTRLPLSYPHQPQPLPSLSKANISIEWGSDRSEEILAKKSRSFVRLAGNPEQGVEGGQMVHGLRSLGSAALNFCYVASGQIDAYWEIGCWAWDVCAGVVIATEAGAKCYGRGGVPFDDQGKALMGHHYFVIRGLPDDEGEKQQDALTKTFFETVEEWDA